MDAHGHAVLVDFDSCLEFGEPPKKGQAQQKVYWKLPVSAKENDLKGLADIERFLFPPERAPVGATGNHEDPSQIAQEGSQV